MATLQTDFLIIGAGIIGQSIALKLRQRFPEASIVILDKEMDVAQHASGRNSGVLHAGFYYTADSLKARFTVQGSKALKEFCTSNNLPINNCGKLVVATNAEELKQLFELERRGKANGSNVSIIGADEASKIESNIATYEKALYSPDTATVDPVQVCQKLKQILIQQGVSFKFDTQYKSHSANIVYTNSASYSAKLIINSAGLYADKIAQDFGFGKLFTIMPFKGLYLKYTKNTSDIKTNIYPVPNLKNPFLGVHFTKTVDGGIKIGPTAIPAFWRENYSGFSAFKVDEMLQILGTQAKLFLGNYFNFRDLAFDEIKKYRRDYFVGLAKKLVKSIDPQGFTMYTKPGIRAQLLNVNTNQLIQDFVIEGDRKSVHILNAVSPGFTCCFPFAEYVIDKYIAGKF